MRLGIILLALTLVLLVAICDSKSTKKASGKSKDHETKPVKKSHPAKVNESKTHSGHKGTQKNDEKKPSKIAITKSSTKEKVNKKSKTSDKESTKPKNVKKQSKVDKDKEEHDKPKKTVKDNTKSKENLKTIPHNCDEIVEQYANGQMVMYEYKIKMAKCLKGKEEKKSTVPAIDATAAWPSDIPHATDAAAANMYPIQDQAIAEQPQNFQQSQAAFTQDPMSNQAAPVQQNYNFFTRSDIPVAASQPQQDMNQWNALNQDATKKDTLPAPQADDPFASFMNIQSSQNAAPQAAQQQRSDIPAPVPSQQDLQQRSEIPIDASYQAPAAPAYDSVPSNQQAFFRNQVRAWSPEDHGLFPENP